MRQRSRVREGGWGEGRVRKLRSATEKKGEGKESEGREGEGREGEGKESEGREGEGREVCDREVGWGKGGLRQRSRVGEGRSATEK